MGQLIQLGAPRETKASRPARVLLVSPSYAAGPNTRYFPIGLAYISAHIRRFGHEVVPLNMNHFGQERRYVELDRLLRSERLDVVGITGLTVAFNEIDRIVRFIRARSDARVVLGGGITSCESELVMETIRPDFMVVSEGELIFEELLDALQSGRSPASIPGLWSWVDGRPAYLGEGPSVKNLDDLPFPDMELFGIREYLALQSERQIDYHETRFESGRAIPITASRSCPYRCTFCYHAGMGSYRRHSMTNVVDNIQRLIESVPEATHISIYDELFSANKKRIHEFCDLLEERKISLSWYCQLRVDQLDQALLDRMRASGCRHISFGFESGSDAILESMDKKITARQIASAVAMTRQAKIGIQANFLFGDPAETLETLQESLRFQEEHQLNFVDWSAVIPYPGTRVYNYALEKGLIGDRVKFIRSMCNISGYLWNDMINMTALPDPVYQEWYVRLRELNDQNHRQRPIVVRSALALDRFRSRMTLVCPHCQRVEEQTMPYPPGANEHALDLRGPLGMQGFNIVCGACNRKSHLRARDIPHVALIFERFQQALDRWKQSGTEVVVLPAMDRYWGVFSQDIDLSGLPVRAVLDSRPKRLETEFLGQRTQPLDPETIARHRGCAFVILPWIEYERGLTALQEAGVPASAILCWNEMFGEQLRGSSEDLPARAAV